MIGYIYKSSHGLVWRENQRGLLPLSPGLVQGGLQLDKAKDLLNSSNAFFIRWDSDFDTVHSGAWWHVIKDKFEPLEELSKKVRYMLRKGTDRYLVKKIEKREVLELGYSVYVSAYSRYNTHEPMFNKDEFLSAIESLPRVTEFFGVFDRESGELVAFSENYIENEVCFYVTMWCTPESMKKFSSYVLFHEMEKHYLYTLNFKYVSDGTRSINHDTNIHNFLISKFNFRKAYSRLNVCYQPWLLILVKFLFPFRKFIGLINNRNFKRITILLTQEAIRRQCMRRLGE